MREGSKRRKGGGGFKSLSRHVRERQMAKSGGTTGGSRGQDRGGVWERVQQQQLGVRQGRTSSVNKNGISSWTSAG